MKAWLVLACAGCTVPPLELAGKSCPCVSGYTCDTATNTCVAGQTASCLASPIGAERYSTSFDDFAGWTQGAGSWTVQAGTAVQSDRTSDFAYAFRPTLADSDYRIISTFRVLEQGTGDSVSPEISARVQLDGSGGQYHCNWDPFAGGFSIMYSASPIENGFLQQVFLNVFEIPDYDPMAWFTMEFQVRGSRLDCCVRGVGGAAGFVNDTRFATGAPGMKTFMTSAAYDDYFVFATQ